MKAERKVFGKLQNTYDPPDLIEIQTKSYAEFLQEGVPPAKREERGLQAVFHEIFPVESFDGRYQLEFVKYYFEEPKYGYFEASLKLPVGKGTWPAFWMMGENFPIVNWPACGEIDIIERLNSDDFVYHTVHSGWTAKNPNNPPKGGKGMINPTGWNIYALEWTSEKIVWKVNGVETHSYARVGDDPARYPWTEPFYLMIDMQLGGSWVGDVDESTLPCKMYVDWVKYYGLSLSR